MGISKEQVTRIANLARLDLKEEKIEKFANQFSDIIGYMDKMNSMDTSGVTPLYSPSDNVSVLRRDKAESKYERQDVLANAPLQDGKYFIVPKIL
ncbi:MAG: Asp-tRNA(Asn)/Glu-tRNA(Gln) amidotransferase subunit GatC [Desulfonatronovibrio sp.]